MEAVNALTILFDESPDRISADPSRLPQRFLPQVDAGLPADLSGWRPHLRAAVAATDTTRASYYPPLSLTGALGSASDSLGNLLASLVATLGGDWLSETDYAILVAQFRQALARP